MEVKPFIFKIFSMLSDPERYQDVILWECVLPRRFRKACCSDPLTRILHSHVGEAFFVAHNDRFVNEVLREQFQHSNIHSFTRESLPTPSRRFYLLTRFTPLLRPTERSSRSPAFEEPMHLLILASPHRSISSNATQSPSCDLRST